ncbi:hypothetical protein OG444_16865 [Streptomyces sp. NBC_01232]|uniref:hypothetical protein n=1 Tax=Streptomyces sp. NBC_01232 TaxID=2903786 RepID=UPI002E0D1056|nr:hypothetical protein OG444_16865 [Streptomyces sp. NBC_01232]
MTTTGTGSMHPLVEHLRGIQAGERDKRAAVNAALTKARHELADVQRRVTEAERSLMAADARLSAVTDTVRQAEEFLGVVPSSHSQAEPEGQPGPPAPESSESRAPGSDAPRQAAAQPGARGAAEPKTLEKLVLEALAGGLETPVSAIVAHAGLARPGTTARQITNCASRLQRNGKILIVSRGFYRLTAEEPRT